MGKTEIGEESTREGSLEVGRKGKKVVVVGEKGEVGVEEGGGEEVGALEKRSNNSALSAADNLRCSKKDAYVSYIKHCFTYVVTFSTSFQHQIVLQCRVIMLKTH